MSKIEIENVVKQDRIDRDVTKKVILYKGEAYTFFDQGLTRYVFVNADKTKVIKLLIERREYGTDYNLEESEIYNNADEDVRKDFAKTELAMNGTIVEQEFCNPMKLDDRKLTIPQMLFAASCRDEVGWNKEGRLVCFDLDEYKKW